MTTETTTTTPTAAAPAVDIHTVPVLDIAPLMASNGATAAGLGDLVAQLRAAATEWGFFYIANHGLTDDEVEGFRRHMRAFFGLPKELKRQIRRTATNARGYFDDELTKNKTDWKEGLDIAGPHEDGPTSAGGPRRMNDDENQWLDETVLPGFRSCVRGYFARMEHLSRRLLRLFTLALDVEPPTALDEFFQSGPREAPTTANSSFLRLNYYPVAPDPAGSMGVHRHTDAGALTVLLQDDDVASLQVFHRGTQAWHLIPPRKGTFVINIGDLLQVWSNDRFLAPLHRVLANGAAERFSAPFFYNPSYEAVIEPLLPTKSVSATRQEDNTPQDQGDGPRYRPLPWFEFRLRRFQGDYADYGQEVQISDYRCL